MLLKHGHVINRTSISRLLVFFFITLIVSSCRKDELPKEDLIHSYLHLSHTRTNDNSGIYSPLYSVDYSKYDLLLLGGDMANLTSLDDNILSHVDSVFDLSAETTLLTVGNHDYTDIDLLSTYTKRPTFYAYYQNDATFIVLDTQDSLSNIIGLQRDFLNSVLDTISSSRQLFILTHKLIWMDDDGELSPQIDAISNGIAGDCFYCVNPNNFYSEIYPKLIELESNGTNVTCIAGDVGFKVNSFSYETTDGIAFYASGIDYTQSEEWNQALKIEHNISQNHLIFSFVSIGDL